LQLSKGAHQKELFIMSACDIASYLALRHELTINDLSYHYVKNAVDVFYREHGDKSVPTFVDVYIKRRDAPCFGVRSRFTYTTDEKDIENIRADYDKAFNNIRIAAMINGIPDEHIALLVEPERIKLFLEKIHPLTEALPDSIPSANKMQREFWTRFLPNDK